MTEDVTEEKVSRKDIIDSLTGYEEDEVRERFGGTIAQLVGVSISKLSRALVYVQRVRAGDEKPAAYDHAQSLRLADLNELFKPLEDDDDDFDADEPDTEQGKDDSPSD